MLDFNIFIVKIFVVTWYIKNPIHIFQFSYNITFSTVFYFIAIDAISTEDEEM